MESLFVFGEPQRAASLRRIMQHFRSTYICLWSYSPLPSNCLLFLDGFYDEEKIQQPSSSSGSLGTRLFNAYCGSVIDIDNECLPGFAFKNNVPYLEVKLDYLETTMLTTQPQMQFYQEAGIKAAVFMGCAAGEIELGFSTHPQLEIQSWFSVDFSFQPSSSSMDSTPSFLDIPKSYLTTNPSREGILQTSISISTIAHPSLNQIPEQQMSSSAFTRYEAAVAVSVAAPTHNPNIFARSLSLFRNLNMRRARHELQIQGNRNHVIAERRRRDKLNQSFQILRTLLPPLSKKDKASVLSSTGEYLRSLRSQMGELKRRNVVLEMQVSREEIGVGGSSSSERLSVEIDKSTSQPRFLDLRMSLRSAECSLSEFVARILGSLKHHTSVSLLSVQSNTTIVESTPVHGLVLRLEGEGDEFDESSFQEAVRRIVDDLPH